MLPPKLQLPPDQQRLLKAFRALSDDDRHSVLGFAEYLVQRAAETTPMATGAQPPAVPADIPRPESESVVAAIRRLSETFPMLDKETLLHETSALMTAHVMQGRSAPDVIDELEVVFRSHYERVISPKE